MLDIILNQDVPQSIIEINNSMHYSSASLKINQKNESDESNILMRIVKQKTEQSWPIHLVRFLSEKANMSENDYIENYCEKEFQNKEVYEKQILSILTALSKHKGLNSYSKNLEFNLKDDQKPKLIIMHEELFEKNKNLFIEKNSEFTWNDVKIKTFDNSSLKTDETYLTHFIYNSCFDFVEEKIASNIEDGYLRIVKKWVIHPIGFSNLINPYISDTKDERYTLLNHKETSDPLNWERIFDLDDINFRSLTTFNLL